MIFEDILDDAKDEAADLGGAVKDFKKTQGKFKKSSKSIMKAAKGNVFEFPVFIANSVPLDYAEATVSLLEQVYASYLQMAISINPVIDDDMARKGAQFDHLRSDTNKYLECVDPTDMPYAYDACHNVFVEDGIRYEFNLVNIEDSTARIINEAMDHQPLSEFDHYFNEAYIGDGAGFFEGCEFIQEGKYSKNKQKNKQNQNSNQNKNKQNQNSNQNKQNQNSNQNQNNNQNIRSSYSLFKSSEEFEKGMKDPTTYSDFFDYDNSREVTRALNLAGQYQKFLYDEMKAQAALREISDTSSREYKLAEARLKEAESKADMAKKDADAYVETLARKKSIDEETLKQLKKNIEKSENDLKEATATWDSRKKKIENDARKSKADADRAEKDAEHYDEDRDIKNKKTKVETTKAEKEIEKMEREDKWAKEDRNLDRMRKMNEARVKTPQFLDETKIQKLNTMKPLMMTVDLNVVDKNGSLSRPVSYIVGVKCHTRIIESDILPEVAAYPLKEMNKKLRKVRWRAGELKFGRDILWKKTSKKQTASDSRDPKRKWYRRLYELAHMSGDGTAAASVKNGKSPWANWWKDKLTGGNNADVGHGLIPNATIVMSKADIDNIKREKDIDLLKGSKATKFCKELFLIGLIVIDDDKESIKVIFPDYHNDYEVHSLAAIKKQLAMLDTAGTKTRDIMKILG